ncbi:MAG: tyrosine--tRNA ligase [bacterium]|nr:tyrosine--tRNA ligase [bacterium]
MSVFQDLEWRGLVYDASEGVEDHLAGGGRSFYIGFDPSARSLHVGSLLQIFNMARMQRFGHTPIVLAGGGTGLIGDPTGKAKERQLLTTEQVAENLVGIKKQLGLFLDFDSRENPARMVDNGDWLTTIPLVEFLRDIGKHFTVNYMLAKEGVQRRLEGEDGISYTEFTYLLLQSYDFLVLHDRHDCSLQMGGSDQWGNITAGAELIRRLRRKKAYALVSPLVMTSSGVKFGKTEAGAVWLDAELTSPYRFYQYWLGTDDRDVIKYLKYFTWLDRDEIGELETAHQAAPEKREAHHALARDVTERVHGPTALERAERSSRVLFGAEISDFASAEIREIFGDVPSTELAPAALDGGLQVTELMVTSGLTPSKGAAKRLIRDGGLYVNNLRVRDERAALSADDFLEGSVLVLRKGQKHYHLVTVAGESS